MMATQVTREFEQKQEKGKNGDTNLSNVGLDREDMFQRVGNKYALLRANYGERTRADQYLREKIEEAEEAA